MHKKYVMFFIMFVAIFTSCIHQSAQESELNIEDNEEPTSSDEIDPAEPYPALLAEDVYIRFTQVNQIIPTSQEVKIFQNGKTLVKTDNDYEELNSTSKDVLILRDVLLKYSESLSSKEGSAKGELQCKDCLITSILILEQNGNVHQLTYATNSDESLPFELNNMVYEIDRFLRHKTN